MEGKSKKADSQRASSLLHGIHLWFDDPLYEGVSFLTNTHYSGKRQIFYGSDQGQDKLVPPEDLLAILESYEFNRLNFLRQAGLVWLVCPSAVHTRFSHSIGVWRLAEHATAAIQVCLKGGRFEPLSNLLRRTGLLDEFQLALLLHDIGHLPFSHVLENLDEFPSHEEIGCEFIMGEGRYAKAFRELVKEQPAGRRSLGVPGHREDSAGPRHLHEILLAIQGKNYKMVAPRSVTPPDLPYICFLMDPTAKRLEDLKPPIMDMAKEGEPRDPVAWRYWLAPILSQLVSGVIDIDRLDHYQRDIYFICGKLKAFKPQRLFANLCLDLSGPPEEWSGRMLLTDEGIDEVFDLLWTRHQLTSGVFLNPRNVANHAMMREAVSRYLATRDGRSVAGLIPLWEDEKLFETLLQRRDIAGDLARRVHDRDPYVFVGRYELREPFASGQRDLSVVGRIMDDKWLIEKGETSVSVLPDRITAWLLRGLKTSEASTDILAFRRPDFGKSKRSGDWLDLSILRNEKDEKIASMTARANFIKFIRSEDARLVRSFWLFATSSDLASLARGKMKALLEDATVDELLSEAAVPSETPLLLRPIE